MKILFPLCLLILTALVVSVTGQQPIKLPKAISEMVNRTYPGWRFSEVTSEVNELFEQRFPSERPNLVTGDFDGDGGKDYAILIEHKDFRQPGEAFTHIRESLIFLKRGIGYKRIRLKDGGGPANPIVYINLAKRGTWSREFVTNKKFRYPTDSISISYFEKASGTYIYKKGRFHYVLECD